MIEGLSNSNKLVFEDDRLELRYMDELFMVEKHIGDVAAVIGLQFYLDKDKEEEGDIVYEEFPEPEVKQVKPRGEGEEGDEAPEEQPPAEEGEEKKPVFKVEDYKWTVTDRKPKNLA